MIRKLTLGIGAVLGLGVVAVAVAAAAPAGVARTPSVAVGGVKLVESSRPLARPDGSCVDFCDRKVVVKIFND